MDSVALYGGADKSLVPFAFQAVRLRESCWIDGKPYFTRFAVGEWLGYAAPQKAIDKIIERNPHLRDPRWSVAVKLTGTDGKQYEHQVFDPIGFQLIVFESRQPKALEYKVAVANLAWAYMTGQLTAYRTPQGALAEALALPKGSRARATVTRAIAAEHGWSVQGAQRRLRRLERGLPAEAPRSGYHYIQKKYRAIHPRALELRRLGLKFVEIAAALRIPKSTAAVWGKLAVETGGGQLAVGSGQALILR